MLDSIGEVMPTNWKRGKVKDPVCGMYVDPKIAVLRTIQGIAYYFCNKECADKFQRMTLTVQASSGENIAA